MGGPRRSSLQRSATLPANPSSNLARNRVTFRVRSPSTDQAEERNVRIEIEIEIAIEN